MKPRCTSKTPGLRDAEGRVRALTREVGSLREELRRESKRREWAVGVSKDKEEEVQQCRERIKEVSYVNKKLSQELSSSQEAARGSAAKNRAAVQSLKDGLAEVEAAVESRAAQGKQRLDLLYTGLQTLEGLLLSHAPPGVPGAAPALPVALRPEVQRILGECMRCSASVGSLLAGPAGGLGQVLEVDEGKELVGADVHHENARLRGELVRANVELAAAEEVKNERVSVAEMRSSLGQYRNAVSKLQAQVASMRERLDEGTREKALLRDEISTLQHAIREQEAKHVEVLATVEQRESAGLAALHRLEEDTRQLRESCAAREQRAARMQSELEDMRTQLTEKEETVFQQRAMISDLQETISNQRNDIRSAMDLIVDRPNPSQVESPRRHLQQLSYDKSQYPVTSVPEFSPQKAESPTNLHTHYHWHQDPIIGNQHETLKHQNTQVSANASWSQGLKSLPKDMTTNIKCNYDKPECFSQKREYGVNTTALRQDMDKIDLEIADLDAAIKAAAQKFS